MIAAQYIIKGKKTESVLGKRLIQLSTIALYCFLVVWVADFLFDYLFESDAKRLFENTTYISLTVFIVSMMQIFGFYFLGPTQIVIDTLRKVISVNSGGVAKSYFSYSEIDSVSCYSDDKYIQVNINGMIVTKLHYKEFDDDAIWALQQIFADTNIEGNAADIAAKSSFILIKEIKIKYLSEKIFLLVLTVVILIVSLLFFFT